MEFKLAGFGNIEGKVYLKEKEYILSGVTDQLSIDDLEYNDQIIIAPEGGKFGDSEDNFLFVYTTIDPCAENFELSANFSIKFLPDSFYSRQDGYGIIAVDTVASGKKICRYRNQVSVGRFRMNSPFETGCGMRIISGYSDPGAIEFGNNRLIDTSRTAVEIPFAKQISNKESFFFSLRKTDEGFTAEIRHAGQSETIQFPGCDLLMVQDPEQIHIGFAAAGNMNVVVSNVQYSLTDGKKSHTPEDSINSAVPDYPFSRNDAPITSGYKEKKYDRDLFASPEGNSVHPGTKDQPLDLQSALNLIEPGHTITLLDGIYTPSEPYVAAFKGISSDNRQIHIVPQHPEKAVLDGKKIQKRVPVMILSGNNWDLQDLIFQNSPSAGLFLSGSYNHIERCKARKNLDTGFLLCSFPGTNKKAWPSHNEICFCESYNNCDWERNNADGFGAKLSVGEGNRFYECIAHHNIDDGFDLYTKSILGPISPVTIEKCIAYENGHLTDEKEKSKNKRGVGFKFGGENQAVCHVIKNCIAYKNDGAGFDSNSNPVSRLIELVSCRNGIRPDIRNYNFKTERTDIEPSWYTENNTEFEFLPDQISEKIRSRIPKFYEASDQRPLAVNGNYKKNIMFLVPRLSGGGAEKVTASLASYMSQKHHVYLVTTSPADEQETYPVSDDVFQINLQHYIKQSLEAKNTITAAETIIPRQNKLTASARIMGIINNKIKGAARRLRNILRKICPQRIKNWINFARNGFTKYPDNETVQQKINAVKELKLKYNIDCSISLLNPSNYLNAKSKIAERNIISIRSCLEGPFAPPESIDSYGHHKIVSACKETDRIIAVSKETAYGLEKKWGAKKKKLSVIYNYLDLEKIDKLSEVPLRDFEVVHRIQSAEIVFFSCGRLTVKKGQWHLIRAFRKVVQSHPNAVLMILGYEGKKKENMIGLLQQIISKNDLEKNVYLLGFHMNPYKYLQYGDIFVFSSFNEGFPNALAEAMAIGLPVISTDCRSGPREILAPNTNYLIKTDQIDYAEFGILIPECSGNIKITEPLEREEEMLADAMLAVADNKNMRNHYCRKSIERAEQFDRKKLLSKWDEVIDAPNKNKCIHFDLFKNKPSQ